MIRVSETSIYRSIPTFAQESAPSIFFGKLDMTDPHCIRAKTDKKLGAHCDEMIHLITLSADLIMILGTSIADTGLLMIGLGWAWFLGTMIQLMVVL